MKIPLAKLKAILLFLCNNTDPKFLGKVKLMKLFYFVDFVHVKKYGVPITHDRYIKLEHGPIPSAIKNLVDTATEDIDHSVLSDTIACETPDGTNMCRILAKKEFSEKDKKYFSESELAVLNQVCKRFGSKNTQYIEEASHSEAPWKETELLDDIPYSLAARDVDCEVSEEDIILASEIFQG